MVGLFLRASGAIAAKYTDECFLTDNVSQTDWDSLTRSIINRINKGTPKTEKFLLLLDEADNRIELYP